jgi:hypothetical protein
LNRLSGVKSLEEIERFLGRPQHEKRMQFPWGRSITYSLSESVGLRAALLGDLVWISVYPNSSEYHFFLD